MKIIDLLCFDLGKRLDLTKIHRDIIKEPWVDSSYLGQEKNFKSGDLLDLYFESEKLFWSEIFLEKKNFLRIALKPFFIKLSGDRKNHKTEIVFTVYRTGFASLALWIHYQGRELTVDDILKLIEDKIFLNCVFPVDTQLIPNTAKKKMTISDLRDGLRVFFHNKIMQTSYIAVKEVENSLRERRSATYNYYVILQTKPEFESPEELSSNYPLEMSALLIGEIGEWKYERKDLAHRRLEDISLFEYEKFYVDYYAALELHAASSTRHLKIKAKKSKRTYDQELMSHILDSLVEVELYNYLFEYIRYLNKETSRNLRELSSVEELAGKTRDILIDIEHYYDLSFETGLAGKEWLKKFKEKMGIEDMFSSLKMKIDYLRALTLCEFQASSQQQEARFGRKVSILTVILTLAVFSEVLISYAQINSSFQEISILLAFLFPIILVFVALLLLSR